MTADLDRLFCPRSIAVIGASADLAAIGGQPIKALRDHGYPGPIYPVNPKYQEVAGLPCYPAIDQVPGPVDLALVALQAKLVPQALRTCAAAGVKAALVFSGGFAEAGEEGRRLQEEIGRIAAETGLRLVGPNCQGLMNLAEGVWAGFGAPFAIPALRPGAVSMVTQSGGFGYAVVSLAEAAGVGFRLVVSSGNEADLRTEDFLAHFIADPGTRIIASYVEGLKDGPRFLELADRALACRKPILVWKVGNSDSGRQAAASHTASLAGSAEVYQAIFREKGILEVRDVADLIDLARAFAPGRLPAGCGVGIVTISGGAGVLAADRCAELGLQLPALAPETIRALRQVVPAYASLLNPVDVTAQIFNQPDLLQQALALLIADPGIHSLIVCNASVSGALATRVARAVAAAAAAADKPVLVAWSAREALAAEAYAILAEAGVPRYETPARAAAAAAALARYGEAVRRQAAGGGRTGGRPASAPADPGARLRSWPDQPAEYQVKELLAAYGLPPTRERLATTPGEALAAAAEIGYPVALKVQSPEIPHKTEMGGVILGIRSPEELQQAYATLLERVRRHAPDARLHGLLVQEMVEGAVEVILGVSRDPVFGPVVMFGLGGIFTEVLRDVSFRAAPLTRETALAMVQEIRGFPVLAGARGRPPADLDALADALVRLSHLATDLAGEADGLDINPLFVLPAGRGVKVGDALLTRTARAERATALPR